MRKRQDLETRISTVKRLEQTISDSVELIELGEMEGDNSVIEDAEAQIKGLRPEIAQLEIETLLSGEADSNDSFLEVHAGAGGTESQDWASMLMRMYTRWAERQGYKVEIIELHDGEEAGIKSATLKVNGHNAYGRLKTESGVHRLVRISPYDSNARRHTSFASVWAYPVVDDNIEIEVNESDCRIDTYRASGAGGQHVNTTDSAVRITHRPSGLVVSMQDEKSQLQNREKAMRVLRARLYEQAIAEQNAEIAADRRAQVGTGERSEKIRTYNYPDRRVTDHRVKVTVHDLDAVLDGDLDQFTAALQADEKSRLLEAQAGGG